MKRNFIYFPLNPKVIKRAYNEKYIPKVGTISYNHVIGIKGIKHHRYNEDVIELQIFTKTYDDQEIRSTSIMLYGGYMDSLALKSKINNSLILASIPDFNLQSLYYKK